MIEKSEAMTEINRRLEEAEAEMNFEREDKSEEDILKTLSRIITSLEDDFYDCNTPERLQVLKDKTSAFNKIATPAINQIAEVYKEKHYKDEYNLKVGEQNIKKLQHLNDSIRLSQEVPESKQFIALGLCQMFGLTSDDMKQIESHLPESRNVVEKKSEKDVIIGVRKRES